MLIAVWSLQPWSVCWLSRMPSIKLMKVNKTKKILVKLRTTVVILVIHFSLLGDGLASS